MRGTRRTTRRTRTRRTTKRRRRTLVSLLLVLLVLDLVLLLAGRTLSQPKGKTSKVPLCTNIRTDSEVDIEIVCLTKFQKGEKVVVAFKVERTTFDWFVNVPEDVSLNNVYSSCFCSC
jgi:hypothetical protein